MKLRFFGWSTIVLFAIALLACSSMGGDSSVSGMSSGGNAQFEEVYGKAEKALKQVNDAGGAWAYTEDTLKEARSLADKQEFDKAIKLAKEAITESELALQQHQSQKNAGPYLF